PSPLAPVVDSSKAVMVGIMRGSEGLVSRSCACTQRTNDRGCSRQAASVLAQQAFRLECVPALELWRWSVVLSQTSRAASLGLPLSRARQCGLAGAAPPVLGDFPRIFLPPG